MTFSNFLNFSKPYFPQQKIRDYTINSKIILRVEIMSINIPFSWFHWFMAWSIFHVTSPNLFSSFQAYTAFLSFFCFLHVVWTLCPSFIFLYTIQTLIRLQTSISPGFEFLLGHLLVLRFRTNNVSNYTFII